MSSSDFYRKNYPQTKSLPWIHTRKSGRPNSFGYESKRPIVGSHRGSYSVVNVCIIVRRTKGYHACTELEIVEKVALWATKITFFLLGYEYHASNEATVG